jgi:murein L,D-transpeptidase YafK
MAQREVTHRMRHRPQIAAALLLYSIWLAAIALPADAELAQIPEPKHAQYRIAIFCSKKVLQLWDKTELVREYPIECGRGGLWKRRSGDHKTPVGDYEITWMASRSRRKGHRIVDGRSWCKDNRFIDAATGPRLEKLWSDSYGGLEAAVISINYPNRKDTLRGFTGECIHIHANRYHQDGILKKSCGCIHMFPADANELYDLVDVGTPVKILP